MKSLFSDTQVEQLITYVETRSGKSGLLRYAGQLYSKHVVTTNQGFAQAPTGFQGAHAKILEGNDDILNPPKDQLEEAPNLAQIDRSYWLSGDPLPVTEGNLLRGKEVFLQRCVGCHGIKGDGKGPGAPFMSPPPADFTDKDDACCGGDTGPGDFYYRILRGWPGTAMENFGDRLCVDDIWRVVLFVKTIPNHTLRKNVVPEPKDYIVWQPSKELLAWLKSRQKLAGQRVVLEGGGHRSVHAGGDEGHARARARRQVFLITTGRRRSPRGRGRGHQGDLPGSAGPSLGRGPGTRRQAAPGVAEGHPPDRPGPAMSRLLVILALVVLAACALRRRPRSLTTRPKPTSRVG